MITAVRRRFGALVCATVLAALAAAGCGSGGGSSSASAHASVSDSASPSCLPSTLDRSAKLSGSPLDVSPVPGTDTADPHTQISFLGAAVSEIHDVSVLGTRSGGHSGRLEAYSQGDGASFVPDKPFTPGEQVAVHAVIGAAGDGKRISFDFGVDTPYSTAAVGPFRNPTPAPADEQSFDTLPGVQAPVLTVTTADRDPAAGDILMTNGPGPGHYGELIYTPRGQLVWFHQLSGGLTADDLNVQTYDGQRDLTFWQGKVLSWGFGQGQDLVVNSRYQTVATVKAGNGLKADLHDFQIAPRGVAYISAYNPIRCDLSSAQGPRNGVILDPVVQEIDIKTGLVRWEWQSLDHVAVSESETSPPKAGFWDYFHLNSIDRQPDGNIFISARNTWAGYEIQAGSGSILWRLGGLESSFKLGAGTKTAWQHDGRVLSDGEVTFFDDGSDPTPSFETQSRAIRIALDFKTHQARLVSSFTHPGTPLLAASQGNMQTLPDGNTFVAYGGVPELSEYAKDGTLLFDAHLPYDWVFYRGFRFPWHGRPLSPPAAVANVNNTGLETIVHMSWNGATDVASWRVLAGSHRGALAPQTTVTPSGFESSTVLPKRYAYVMVQALDSAGHVLGSSHTAAVETYSSSFPTERSG